MISFPSVLALPALLLALAQPSRAGSESLPVDYFFRDFKYTSMSLSPSGRFIAALYPSNDTHNIALIDIDTMSVKALTGFEFPDRVSWVDWKGNDYVLYQYFQQSRTSEYYGSTRIASVDVAGKKHENLANLFYSDVASWLYSDPRHIAVTSYTTPNIAHVYRIDITNGKWEEMPRTTLRDASFLLDHAGAVRAAIVQNDDLASELRVRESDRGEWRNLQRFAFAEPGIQAINFTADNRDLIVVSDVGRATQAVYRLDVERNTLGDMIAGRDDIDVDHLIFTRDSRRLLGASFRAQYNEITFVDPEMRELHAEFMRAFPGYEVQYASFSEDGKRIILLVGNARQPGRYYLYDKRKGDVAEIIAAAPWIDERKLSDTRPIQFAARDGVAIHGYLTVPGAGGDMFPTLVVPHGGPFGIRDVYGFDREVQFFANRGYAVLQINFRGSGGYGGQFRRSGFREWGGKMQDDITDGVKWAIAQHIADPARICTYGASYGGYSALMGLALTPELYRCGITYAGVSDLTLLYDKFQSTRSGRQYYLTDSGRAFLNAVVGERRDKDYLRARSPVHNAARIKVPVFIAHGGEDSRVPLEHATDLRAALQGQKTPVEWMVKYEEGHGYRKESNRIELYQAMEKFLARHLPTGPAAVAAAGDTPKH